MGIEAGYGRARALQGWGEVGLGDDKTRVLQGWVAAKVSCGKIEVVKTRVYDKAGESQSLVCARLRWIGLEYDMIGELKSWCSSRLRRWKAGMRLDWNTIGVERAILSWIGLRNDKTGGTRRLRDDKAGVRQDKRATGLGWGWGAAML